MSAVDVSFSQDAACDVRSVDAAQAIEHDVSCFDDEAQSSQFSINQRDQQEQDDGGAEPAIVCDLNAL